MDDIIKTIQQDILNPKLSMASILIKAKVLAHQLKNDEFKQWVKNELDGYKGTAIIPDYRILAVQSVGTFENLAYTYRNNPIPTGMIPDGFREKAARVEIRQGISEIEELATKEQLQFPWSGDWIGKYNDHNQDSLGTYHLIEAHAPILGSKFGQITQTIRSRLQDFIFEISDLPWSIGKELPPVGEVERLMQVIIYNSAQGGNMSTFDQRGQQVQYQYNAAGNINFGAVQNKVEVVRELEKLQDELTKAFHADLFDEDTATDAEYQLKKAVQQAKKPETKQDSILEHLNEAKALISGVAGAAGLVTALVEAADKVRQFF